MAKRKGLSKKLRFDVFKRDSFTCQYCGAKAPDVVLQVDHVAPHSKGGSDSILNLVTSCVACNGGKGATPLSDQSAIEKQRRQLEELQARRDQIDMMVEWQKGLANVDDYATEQLGDYWSQLVPGWSLNDIGKKGLRKHIRDFGLDRVMEGMRIATEQYVKFEGDPPRATNDSVALAWARVGGICYSRKRDNGKPHMPRLRYVRGILRNRLSWFDESEALVMLERTFNAGATIDELELLAKRSTHWSQWESDMADLLAEHGVYE